MKSDRRAKKAGPRRKKALTYTIPEAAELLGISRQSGYNAAARGENITTFLNLRGFSTVKGLNSSDYHQAYFRGPNKNRIVSKIFSFVWAEIKYFENKLTTR